jgi:glycosyltransferase involved in cell wall biosynthesis
MFGNLRAYKGADLIIDTFLKLKQSQKLEVKLVIAGQLLDPIPEADPFIVDASAKNISTENKDILVLNQYLKDAVLAQLLGKALAVVFPYRHIDSSAALNLAMNYEKFIICSELPEFVSTLENYHQKSFLKNIGTSKAVKYCPESLLAALKLSIQSRSHPRSTNSSSPAGTVTLVAAQQPGWKNIAEDHLSLWL